MQNTFSNALSEAVSKDIPLSATRRETLALLVMRQSTICLWRLVVHATIATTDSVGASVLSVFPAFGVERSDAGACGFRVAGHARQGVGSGDGPDQPGIRQDEHQHPDGFGDWNDMSAPMIWTLLPIAGNSNTKTRTELLDRLRETFPDLQIASLMGDREFIGDAWMSEYPSVKKLKFMTI